MSDKYHRQRRSKALAMYGEVCMCCGKTKEEGINLQADHIFPQHSFKEHKQAYINYQILCDSCNRIKGLHFIKDYRYDLKNWNRYSEETKFFLKEIEPKMRCMFDNLTGLTPDKVKSNKMDRKAKRKQEKKREITGIAGSKPIPAWLK